ncbi:methionine gamma-lyase [Parachitinimonas caeni]|uniref:L-methionine gamma-lyase n=1 Tax=Parachitinimonas caeni TaxID=3031301 RepID=A0ABT7DS84_9NEIS|nr:methionine gamma-lyase [Parachitinimonas caeni]MDK2122931.1 methionine gamma-lyase [Parachitinimonas caeni]
MSTHSKGFATRAIHHGYKPADALGALTPPLHLTSTFAFDTVEQGGARFAGEESGYIYTRLGNPTLNLLEQRVAALEGGEAALAFASGMGAITAAMWTLLQPGDEIVVDKTLYGCTFAFLTHGLAKFGITIRHIDLTEPANLPDAMSDRTRLVYFETPANPNMRLVDIEAIAAAAHKRGAKVMVDNTYCSPALQNPILLGADLVVHSATKYLGGHGDLTAGILIGDAETIQQVRFYGLKDMTGAVLSPFDAFLILRGLKTLELRLERHSQSAMQIAEFLQARPEVAVVHYPGLKTFPQHELACRQMRGFGGMLAFELKDGIEAGRRFMNSLQMIVRAVSLGDAETLIQHPATMTHSTYTPEERAQYGISDGLIRLSVGLETVSDIVADLGTGFDAIKR